MLTKDGRPNHAWKPGQDPFEVEAELAVGFGGLEERYISNVVGVPFERVSVSLPSPTSNPQAPRRPAAMRALADTPGHSIRDDPSVQKPRHDMELHARRPLIYHSQHRPRVRVREPAAPYCVSGCSAQGG